MNPRVFGAIIAGLIIVTAAYLHAPVSSTPSPADAALAVAERGGPVRSYIQTADQDNDSVPDWKQALRTTPPLEINTAATTTYEVPDTLTDQFAIELFNDMIKAKKFGGYGESPEELIAAASDELITKAADTLYTTDDIITSSDTSPEAARRYANRVAEITIDYGIPSDTPNELLILEQAVKTSDANILEELDVIIESYDGMLQAMLNTPVPDNLAKQHLDLINTYQAILSDVRAMQDAFSDPLMALLRVQRYQDDATGLYYAFTNIFKASYEAGARFEAGDSTLQLVTITDD